MGETPPGTSDFGRIPGEKLPASNLRTIQPAQAAFGGGAFGPDDVNDLGFPRSGSLFGDGQIRRQPPVAAQPSQLFGAPFADINIAPGARDLRDEALSRTRQLAGSLTGDIDFLRGNLSSPELQSIAGELSSNQNPFIQARVAPFREAAERGLAQTARGFARRGVQGGLAQSTIADIRRRNESAIADQAALATQQALQGRISVEQLQQNLLSGRMDQILNRQGVLDQVNARVQSLSAQEFEQELRALNIGQQTVDQILASQFPDSQTQRTPNQGQGLGGLLFGAGSALSAFS